MIRALVSWLCFWVLATSAQAQRPDDPGRLGSGERLSFAATLTPDFVTADGAYVGGEIVMHVQFISSDPLKRVRLELPVIEGVRAEVLARPHTRQVEIKGDEGYSILGTRGYSHDARLAIVPVESGTVVIPPITITGISERDDGRSFEFNETIPEQKITVHPKDPEFDGDTWIVSRDVSISEAWSHEISEIQNGDTVRRAVTLTVAGVTADDLPELVLAPNDGYRVLTTEVSTSTEQTDTGFIAHMTQVWDIYVETEDVTYVDEIRFSYWNPALRETRVATVPRQRVEPLKRDALVLRDRLRAEALAEHRAERLGLTVLAWLPAAGLMVVFALVAWRAAPTRADLRFWRAARLAAPLDFYRAYLIWGRQAFGKPAGLDASQTKWLGARAADRVAHLNGVLFGAQGGGVDAERTATTLIFGARRQAVADLFSAISSGLARFLFLR